VICGVPDGVLTTADLLFDPAGKPYRAGPDDLQPTDWIV